MSPDSEPLLTDAPLCHAHKADTGQPCKAFAIRGGKVCVYHGGMAPNVRQRAQERLEAMIDPALDRLRQLIDTADSDSVRLRALELAMDRALGKVTDKLKLSGDQDDPLEIIISRPGTVASTD